MKNRLLIALAATLVGTASYAAEFMTGEGLPYEDVYFGGSPISISQNFDNGTIDPLVAVACADNTTLYTTQNWFLRRYILSDYGIDNLTVDAVTWGVSQFTSDSGLPYSADVVLFTIATGDAFTFANMTEVYRNSQPITAADVGTFLTEAVGGAVTVSPGQDLVTAIDGPDGRPDGVAFRPGANGAGAFVDAFIAAVDCGITEPTGVSDIGFPESQFIFIVDGTADGPTPTIETTWGALKAQ